MARAYSKTWQVRWDLCGYEDRGGLSKWKLTRIRVATVKDIRGRLMHQAGHGATEEEVMGWFTTTELVALARQMFDAVTAVAVEMDTDRRRALINSLTVDELLAEPGDPVLTERD